MSLRESSACLEEEIVAAFIAGSLTQTDLARVEGHLADCARCRGLVADAAAGAASNRGGLRLATANRGDVHVSGTAAASSPTEPAAAASPRVGDREEVNRISRLWQMLDGTSNLPANIASRYIPLRIIGKGGMGVVYEVQHAWTAERLALKVLLTSVGAPPEVLERFKREARASALIRSDNVVRVTDADVSSELDGAPFLVMELLEGMDLERAASTLKPDSSTVVGWLRQVAPALDKAHRLGIVHRDLKPENLFLATVEDRPPIVKILDFGIAKMAQEGTGATVSGQILGTLRYMAPEQARSGPYVSPATDRCALGLIAYRLIVGESYYRGSVMSILAELMHGPLHAPSTRAPSLSPAFDAWFLKACHRTPEERYGSAVEQIEALAEVVGLPRVAIQTAFTASSVPADPGTVETTLPATTVSHLSLRNPKTRRQLFVGMALFALVPTAAFVYRASVRIERPTGIGAAASGESIASRRGAEAVAPESTPPSLGEVRATGGEASSNSGALANSTMGSWPESGAPLAGGSVVEASTHSPKASPENSRVVVQVEVLSPSSRIDSAAKPRVPLAPSSASAAASAPRSDPYNEQK